MSDSSNLHAEGNLSYNDLLEIEKIIDNVPFKRMTFAGRSEFERLYYKFKEYCVMHDPTVQESIKSQNIKI